MDILNIKTKTLLKIVAVCLLIATVTGGLFLLTRGGFFDGILLTFVGLSCTYLILVLAIVLFRTLINILTKGQVGIIQIIIAFITTIAATGYLFTTLFKFIAKEF